MVWTNTSIIPSSEQNDKILELLSSRDTFKSSKDYKNADVAADKLKEMGVCYHDENKTYYIRSKSDKSMGKPSVEKVTKKSKRQLRNKRQAEKNRAKKKQTK